MSVPRTEMNAPQWRKSSYSNQDGGNCLEVADNVPHTVPVRDSKQAAGPILLFTPAAWSAFTRQYRAGRD